MLTQYSHASNAIIIYVHNVGFCQHCTSTEYLQWSEHSKFLFHPKTWDTPMQIEQTI